ncbi:MAG TPA: hypothetical protein VHS09_14485 [Polyangiaceae bacterium]|jgi:multidrug efflux pump subunit AcrA (membrane-fusion protein)|nr:hypothetical protein [Polyangiaceae bacterium]
MRPLLPFLGVALAACASASPPPSTPPAEPGPAATASTAPASVAATDDAPGPRTRPLDLTSACPRDVHLYFGDHPGDGQGQPGVVAAGATIAVPRAPDGTQVVWVVDDKGFGLGNVHITKHMRHIRIDAACMKLDADSTR